jgi:hypothetical protein
MSCLPFGFVLCVGAATASAGRHARIGLLADRETPAGRGAERCPSLALTRATGVRRPSARRTGRAAPTPPRWERGAPRASASETGERHLTQHGRRGRLWRVFDEGEVLLLYVCPSAVRLHATNSHRGVDDAQRAARSRRCSRRSRRRRRDHGVGGGRQDDYRDCAAEPELRGADECARVVFSFTR